MEKISILKWKNVDVYQNAFNVFGEAYNIKHFINKYSKVKDLVLSTSETVEKYKLDTSPFSITKIS